MVGILASRKSMFFWPFIFPAAGSVFKGNSIFNNTLQYRSIECYPNLTALNLALWDLFGEIK